MPEAEEQISELEDKMVEITSEEQNKVKRMKRTEESLRHLWGNVKCANIQIIGVPEEEEKKNGHEKIFEEVNFQMFKLVLEKAEEAEIKLPTSAGSWKKQENSRKTSISALLTMSKPLILWITINIGKFFKRWE